MNGDPTPSHDEQLANLEAQLKKQSLGMLQTSPIEYISHISVQIATLKTIQYQLEEALNVKVRYSTLAEMQDDKIRAMTAHVISALKMLPKV